MRTIEEMATPVPPCSEHVAPPDATPSHPEMRKLYKKIDSTSKTRFYASRRLKKHARYSGYVIAGVSLILIFIALMQSLSLGTRVNTPDVVLIQVYCSVLVLAYSLSIEKNNYAARSEKLYSCASALAQLKVEMTPCFAMNFESKIYEGFQFRYHQILNRYEADSADDFRVDYHRATLDMPEDYVFSKSMRKKEQRRIFWGLAADFAHYYVIFVVACVTLWWLIFFPLS